MKSILLRIVKVFFRPFQSLRGNIIKAMILADQETRPEDSLRWLLQIHDFVSNAIDIQCIRWGGGVHIKHELMDGIHSFFCERIPPGSRVLDIGCGIGAVAYSIVSHADVHVIGIDKDKKNLTFARERFKHPNLEFISGDATKDVPPGRVEVVVLSSVLEHIPSRIELLKTLIDRFRPSLFLIRVPTFERHYFAALKRKLGLFAYTDPSHLLEYSSESFAAEMEQAGLRIRYMEIRWGDIWAECVPQC